MKTVIEETVMRLYACFNRSMADSDVNIVGLYHAIEVAALVEREACAKVCEGLKIESKVYNNVLSDCAAAIRARCEK